MTEQDETQRIEPVEPTRALDPEPTARLDQTAASARPATGLPGGDPSGPQPAATGPAAGASAPGQAWTPPPLGQSGLGQPPVAAPAWAAQQPPWPGAYPPAPPVPGASYGAPVHSATGATYGGPGYPYAGYTPSGYAQGYPPAGYGQAGQPSQQTYGSPYGPYERYARPAQGGYPSAPYNPYPPQYQPGSYQPGPYQSGQQWPAPADPERPRRRTGRTTLVVALALALALAMTGVGWALRPILEPAQRPTAPSVEPVQPNQPTTQPGTGPTPDPDPRPGGAGEAGESAGVVFVTGETSGGIAAGTGMVLTPEGKVLTNYHVVAGTQALKVTIADSGDTYSATVLGFDQSKDVALLQLEDAGDLPTVTIDNDEVKVGDPVAAVGNAGGNNQLVRAPGEVVGLDRSLTVNSDSPWGSQENLSGVIETTAGAVPGHSGGPMFDNEAEVVGITTAGSSQSERSYAVPIADALQVVDTIEAGTDAGTVRVGPAGYLGIVIGEASRHGVTITDVVSGSPADQAGIEIGSTLVQVGDTPVSETINLATVIRALEPGDEVTVEWLTPRGEQRSASVTLTASPVN